MRVKRRLQVGKYKKSKMYYNKRGGQGRYTAQAWKQRPDGPYSMKRKRYFKKYLKY